MAVSCEKDNASYLRQLMQLLPPGYAWQWSPVSAGRHLLAAWADELARVHAYFCSLVGYGITRFAGELSGWSAPDYERLMMDQFNLSATVTDGLLPFTCESACTDYMLEETIRYIIVFTVDDVSAVPQAVYDYLDRYKQSHTHYMFRDRSLSVERVIAVDTMHLGEDEQAVTLHVDKTQAGSAKANDELIAESYSIDRTIVVNGMNCESDLYELPIHAYRLVCHWSFSNEEIQSFPNWPADTQGLLQRNSEFWPNPPTFI